MSTELTKDRIDILVKRGFPRSLIGKEFVDERPEILEKALKVAESYVQKFTKDMPYGLLMAGPSGTGKTMVATYIAARLFSEKMMAVERVNCDDVIRFCNADMFGGADKRPKDYRDLNLPHLLVIDDVPNTISPSRDPMPLVYKVCRERFESGKPTIILSPYQRAEIAGTLGLKFMNFAKEAMLKVSFDGLPDFRDGFQKTLRDMFDV